MFAEAIPPADLQRCVLERIVESEDQSSQGTLIGLHDEQSTHSEMLSFMRSIADGRHMIAPRSARWSAYHEGGRFSWFSSVSPPLIEPIGFGDSLMQLESLILEYIDIGSTSGLVLAGRGQGGTMAITLAALWPELFAGVIAINASWPQVPGWQLPERDMAQLKVLAVGGQASLRDELRARNASLEDVSTTMPDNALTITCCEWISARQAFQPGK
jgi:pimeloyl-ACP methyl ester carboxylesterase